MPGHKNKKKEAGKMGPGGKSPKGGKKKMSEWQLEEVLEHV